MAKKKNLTYEEKMINALNTLPTPIEDKRHGISILIVDDKARSNESRFEHIIDPRHELQPSDIKRIPHGIKTSLLKKDKERSNTYNIYIPRNRYSKEYIKISVEINFKKSNEAKVKTIFITKNMK